MKDLRDTFASQLLTSGVSLGYVCRQLGRADVAVTAKLRKVGGRRPLPRADGPLHGGVPADLLARLADSHVTPSGSGLKGAQPETLQFRGALTAGLRIPLDSHRNS